VLRTVYRAQKSNYRRITIKYNIRSFTFSVFSEYYYDDENNEGEMCRACSTLWEHEVFIDLKDISLKM
jgi:hypothetical protein